MKTTFISTQSLWNSSRSAVNKMQVELARANTEITTGRHADVGLSLGSRTGRGISLRQERAELDALTDGNALVSVRLGVTKTSLDTIRESAEDFLSSLMSLPSTERVGVTISSAARSKLKALESELNRSSGGQYIFGGTNTREKPVKEYFTDPDSEAKASVNSIFLETFTFTQDDAKVSTILPDDMRKFLDEDFTSLFLNNATWSKWSSASSKSIESRISTSEKIASSTSANETAMRQLAMAYTMAADLGLENFNAQTRQVVVEKLAEVLGSATQGLVSIQADLGAAEARVNAANEKMDLQKNIIDREIGRLEGVDPAEAKSRVDALTMQIQMSYSLTSQLRQLSLINYL